MLHRQSWKTSKKSSHLSQRSAHPDGSWAVREHLWGMSPAGGSHLFNDNYLIFEKLSLGFHGKDFQLFLQTAADTDMLNVYADDILVIVLFLF